MSRVGKNPVVIPAGVTVDLKGQHLKAKGKRGELQFTVHDDVEVTRDGDKLNFAPRGESRRARMQWGTARNLASNLVKGVSDGFERKLELYGVGFRAEVKGKDAVNFTIGYSLPVLFKLPEGVTAEWKEVKTGDKQGEVFIRGVDKDLLGRTAAEIRKLRPPEPYKGKGIKYSDEVIQRKQGKAFGS